MRVPTSGPLTPAGVLALQRSVGNQAVGRLLDDRGGEGRIQRRFLWANPNGYKFAIRIEDRYIRAASRVAPMVGSIFNRRRADPQSGYLRYSTTDDSLVIEHIETDPENGTGLGPLLILLAARLAIERDKSTISVVGLRYPEYYARWGFDIETPRAATRRQYENAGREVPAQIAVVQADSTPDEVVDRTEPYVEATWTHEWNGPTNAEGEIELR